MNTHWRLLAIAAIVATAATIASANTISFGPYTVAQQNANSGFSTVVNIQQFDASLGTLTGIELDVIGNFDLDLSIADLFGAGSFGTYTSAFGTGSINVLGPGSLNIPLSAISPVESGTVQKGLNNKVVWAGLPASGSQTQHPTDLADYVGTASTTTALTFQANAFTAQGTGDPGLFYSASGFAGGSISVIYTYAPGTLAVPSAPEPTTWAMMGGAILLFGIRRRRAKK